MITTAAIKDGLVVDIERYDDTDLTNQPAPRPDGLSRTPCPRWVEVGFTYNGTEFRMPDGRRIHREKLDEIADEDDRNELAERILALKDVLPLLRNVTGNQAERIKRIEDALVILIRAEIRETK